MINTGGHRNTNRSISASRFNIDDDGGDGH